jgi:OmpA-OmpF porin, OOP family
MRACTVVAVAITLLASGAPRVARADCTPSTTLSACIDSDNLWPHAGAGPFLSIGSPVTVPAGEVSFGIVTSYLSRPIGLRVASPNPDGTVVYLIDNVVDSTFLWSFGVTDRMELTLAAPVTFYQDGAGLGDVTGSGAALVRSAIRDARAGVTWAVLPRPRAGSQDGWALTSRLEFAVPTATADAFAGGSTMTAVPTVTLTRRIGRLDLAAEAGARLRGEQRLADVVVGSQLSGALGGSFEVLPRHLLTAGAEAFVLGTLASEGPLGPTAVHGPALVPAEWIVSATTAPLLAGNVSFTLGGGGAIPFASEGALTTPRFRFEIALRYAPTGRDTDGDGIPDVDDKCPNEPEDFDGFQDADGCPDPDNDGDGIPDALDKCRDEPEDFDGFQDTDGCPDPDNDGDGIPDVDDRCPNVPEDLDGIQDADGCPENPHP